MPVRNYRTPINSLIEEGQKIVKSNADARFIHRVEMVNLVLSGLPPSKVSKFCRESKNSITSWVKIADEQGFDALKIKKQTGRPAALSDQQRQELRELLAKDDPAAHGYNVWDGVSLANFITKKYQVTYTVRHCQRLFHEMGFSLVRPQTLPTKGENNQAQREEFKKNSSN